jgi:hypothetical protein
MQILLWLLQYNKAFAAFTMTIVYFLNAKYGIEIPLDETSAGIIWSVVAGFITWLVPNIVPEGDTDVENNP